MKSKITLFLGCLFSFVMSSAQNLLTNGDFSSGDLTGWTVVNGTNGSGGAQSGEIIYLNDGADDLAHLHGDGSLYQKVSVIGGTNYKCSIHFKTLNVKQTTGFGYAFEQGGIIDFGVLKTGASALKTICNNNGGVWNVLPAVTVDNTEEFSFLTPDNATAVYICIGTKGAIADLKVQTAELLNMDNSGEEEEDPEPSNNLVQNGDFGLGNLTGWVAVNGTNGPDGAESGEILYLKDGVNDLVHLHGDGSLYQKVNIIGGNSYECSIHFKELVVKQTTGYGYLFEEGAIIDFGTLKIGASDLRDVCTNNNGVWNILPTETSDYTVDFTIQAPENATAVYLCIGSKGTIADLKVQSVEMYGDNSDDDVEDQDPPSNQLMINGDFRLASLSGWTFVNGTIGVDGAVSGETTYLKDGADHVAYLHGECALYQKVNVSGGSTYQCSINFKELVLKQTTGFGYVVEGNTAVDFGELSMGASSLDDVCIDNEGVWNIMQNETSDYTVEFNIATPLHATAVYICIGTKGTSAELKVNSVQLTKIGQETNTPSDNDIDGDGIDDSIDNIINKAPYMYRNVSPAIKQGSRCILTTDYLRAKDKDTQEQRLVYTITELPENGTLLLNGEAYVLGSDNFNIDDITEGKLVYYHDYTQNTGEDRFVFSVSDNIDRILEDQSFIINVQPVTAFPVHFFANIPGGDEPQKMRDQYIEQNTSEKLWACEYEWLEYPFYEWNTAADGSGLVYDEVSIFNMKEAEVNLYAIWQTEPCEIIYRNTYDLEHSNPESYTVEDYVKHLQPLPDMDEQIFGGWYTYDGVRVDSVNVPVIEKRTKGDLKFYAKWLDHDSEDIAQITVETKGGGTTLPEVGSFIRRTGGIQEFTAVSSEGLSFNRWEINGDIYTSETANLPVDDDLHACAYFDATEYNMTISSNATDGITPHSGNYKVLYGETVELEASSVLHQQFDYWMVNGEKYAEPKLNIQVLDDLVIQAVYQKSPHKFLLQVVGGGDLSMSPGNHTIYWGDTLKVEAASTPDWKFKYWMIDGEKSYSNTICRLVDSDIQVKCYFLREKHSVDLTIKGGGVVFPAIDRNTIYNNDTLSIKATPDEDFRFEKWLIGGVEYEDPQIHLVITEDTDIIAIFKSDKVSISTTQVGEGTCSPDVGDSLVYFDSDLQFNAVPLTGWLFDKWVIDDVEYFEPNPIVHLSDHCFATAYFIAYTPQLDIQVNGEGTTVPEVGKSTNSFGKPIELHATPSEGWLFDKWLINGEEFSEATYTLEIDEEVTAIAYFKQLPPELTISTVGEGFTTPSEGVIYCEYAEEISLEAIPADGWKFEKWIVNETELYDEIIVVRANEDLAVEAYFVEASYTITYHANGGSGLMMVEENQKGLIKVSTCWYENEGCRFVGWSTALGGQVEYEENEELEIISDLDLYAVWEVVTAYDHHNVIELALYPNPTNGVLNVESNQLINQVDILSLLGQELASYKVMNCTAMLNINDLPSGQYLLKVHYSNSSIEVKKIHKN